MGLIWYILKSPFMYFQDVRADIMSAEGYMYFEQLNTNVGCLKIGKFCYNIFIWL